MYDNIKINISTEPKAEISKLIKIFNKYLLSWAKAEKPNGDTYSEEYDFIQEKTKKLAWVWYLPLSKFETRFVSQLYQVLDLKTVINDKIADTSDNNIDKSTHRWNIKLRETKNQLLMTIIGHIYISKEAEPKILNTFEPQDIIKLLDIFEEETVRVIDKFLDESRTQELAIGVTWDDDNTDTGQTFHQKVIEHHENNRPIGSIIEDILNTKGITYNRFFTKTIQNANIVREYFKEYPEIFIASYCTILDYKQINEVAKKLFPKWYSLPDRQKYIDERYEIENTIEEDNQD